MLLSLLKADGVAIGTASCITNYVSQKVNLLLSAITKSQLHAAYSAFTHGVISKWLFIARTIPDINNCYYNTFRSLCPTHIYSCCYWVITSWRNLPALPARLGDLGITNPV